MCIFIGYVWGVDNAIEEITSGGRYKFVFKKFFILMIRYVAPVLIFFIWLNAIGVLPAIAKVFGIQL